MGREPDDCLHGGDRVNPPEMDLDPTIDDRYRLLADHRRRSLLYLLSETGERTHTVGALAAGIARYESEGEPRPAAVDIALRHKHLPRLADVGVIEYDSRSETVVYRGDERVESLLAPAKEMELPEE